MKMHMQLLLLWLITPLLLWVAAPAIEATDAKPNCPANCGNTVVPYPFGVGDPNCSRDSSFNLTCNSNQLLYRDLKVRKISTKENTMTVEIPMAYECYNKSSGKSFSNNGSINFEENAPFTLSVKKNRFTAIGCNTIATLEDAGGKIKMSSCMSLCDNKVNVTEPGSCYGVGCCQATITNGITAFKMSFASPNYNRNFTREFNPCSYAFLANHDSFNFSQIDLSYYPEDMPISSQVVLDWAIESESRDSGGRSNECGKNAELFNSASGTGYNCHCLNGYQGNPYLPDGCKDIDECKDPIRYPCEGICKNSPGNYTCECPLGKTGNGNKNETCEGLDAPQLAAVIVSPVLVVFLVISAQYAFEKISAAKYFLKNGGSFFVDEQVTIFSTEILRKATNNYNSERLISQGSTGEVYKGTLSDNKEVVIKKSEVMDENQINQFREEVSIVSKYAHKNVVKLLGLCLETKVPQLVYEFISNKTLFQHIHVNGGSEMISSWKNRLRIAKEIAQALDHFHSMEPPTIHGDIKSKNILIDGRDRAKVSDFGASTLFPSGQSGVAARVLVTMGYLDPEYLQTSDLTTKADVYSFGVILVELLTGEKPFPDEKKPVPDEKPVLDEKKKKSVPDEKKKKSVPVEKKKKPVPDEKKPVPDNRSKERRNVIQKFISSERNGEIQFWKVTDDNPDEVEQMREVATLAIRCLKGDGGERPTMNEVANELIRLLGENEGTQQDPDDVQGVECEDGEAGVTTDTEGCHPITSCFSDMFNI